MSQMFAEFFYGWMSQSFDEPIETITLAIAESTNMREAVTLRQSLSITLSHLTAGFGFEDLIVPRCLMFV